MTGQVPVRDRLLEEEKAEISLRYPDLLFITRNGELHLRGSFPVRDDEDNILDRFQIEVMIPQQWPRSVPMLWEIGGRIPHHKDRHVEDNGKACPIIPMEWLMHPKYESLIAFLEIPVRNFFLYQLTRELNQSWKWGERGHGPNGKDEFYTEHFGTKDRQKILLFLSCLAKERHKSHWYCPCGSGLKIRACHQAKLEELRRIIPPWLARQILSEEF